MLKPCCLQTGSWHLRRCYTIHCSIHIGPLLDSGQRLKRAGAGSFPQPFREDLFFGKIDYQPSYNQTLDLTLSVRDESDVKGFGGH